MKQFFLCGVLCCASSLQSVVVTVQNKSNERIAVTVNSTQKQVMNPRQSKKFTIAALTEQQPAYLTIERAASYWPQTFELKMMAPSQLVLKKESLVVSTKFSKRRSQQGVCAGLLKIGYFGTTPGKQEIMFIN